MSSNFRGTFTESDAMSRLRFGRPQACWFRLTIWDKLKRKMVLHQRLRTRGKSSLLISVLYLFMSALKKTDSESADNESGDTVTKDIFVQISLNVTLESLPILFHSPSAMISILQAIGLLRSFEIVLSEKSLSALCPRRGLTSLIKTPSVRRSCKALPFY